MSGGEVPLRSPVRPAGKRARRVLVVAGELSGDLHAAALVRAILDRDPKTEVLAVGGEALRSAGAKILHPIDDLATVGIAEVAATFGRVLSILADLKRRLRSGEIDLFVPVDLPDFNFRLAPAARRAGVPVFYFIAPQIWAWRRGRLGQMARWCDHVVVLFPFEKRIFTDAGIPTTHIAHPLVRDATEGRTDDARALRMRLGVGADEPLVGLFPGSRRSEVDRHLPIQVEAAARLRRAHPSLRCAIARASSLPRESLERRAGGVRVVDPPARTLMSAADVAVAASGTVTVELALAQTPMVVMYRLHPLSWFLARRLVRVPHVAMVNLVAGERLVPELLQSEATPAALAGALGTVLSDPRSRARMRAGYARVQEALAEGEPLDVAADRALALARRTRR